MKHHLITLALLVAAVICYTASWNTGAFALFAIGGVFELAFWSRLIRSPKSPAGDTPAA
jgi:hypothetical protein